MPIEYAGKQRSVAFNISYIFDVLNVLPNDTCLFQFSDSMQGVLIESPDSEFASYVVMPLTL